MPALPTHAGPAAEFIVRHLYRAVDLTADSRYFAVAETEKSDDAWFWNDDNAKVLELMAQPEVWRRFPDETAEILRFVRSMCRGPFIFRRVAAPRLDALGADRGVSRYRHSLLRISCDAALRVVTVGMRFHDERDADNLKLCGNYVEFTHRGRRFKEPIATGHASTELSGNVLRVRFADDVHFSSVWQRRRLGTLANTYTFDARSMLFDAETALEIDPAIGVHDVVLTIGHTGLEYCLFNNVVTDTSAGTPLYAAGIPSARSFNAAGASYYAIRQAHISAESLAVHSIPQSGLRPSGIETAVETQGRLASVVARYEFPGAHRGTRLVASECKLITAGGYYDRVPDYAALMREAHAARSAQRAACDFSISYDYGATINAFAKCFAAAAGTPGLAPSVALDELRSSFDDALRHYDEFCLDRHASRADAVFSRELALAMLGTATMDRATGCDAYRQRLRRMCDILLEFERPLGGTAATLFPMRKDNPQAYLDCQSAALLALIEAARMFEDERLPAAIERGLAAYRLLPQAVDLGRGRNIDTLGLTAAGTGGSETALWNFKAGLTLRFLAALRNSPIPALQAISARRRESIASFEGVLRRQLAQSTRCRDGCAEFLTSVLSGETNSETQPWVALGLLDRPLD